MPRAGISETTAAKIFAFPVSIFGRRVIGTWAAFRPADGRLLGNSRQSPPLKEHVMNNSPLVNRPARTKRIQTCRSRHAVRTNCERLEDRLLLAGGMAPLDLHRTGDVSLIDLTDTLAGTNFSLDSS
jgi:hypothetical protein